MENKSNKVVYYVIGIIIVAVVIVFLSMNKSVLPVTNNVVDQNVDETAIVPTEDTSTGSVNATVGAASISYTDALVKYADRRIQFDKICQATPNTVTYKDNTGIMIDNRSAVSRTIKIGTNYTVKAYGFKIVVLPDIYLKSKTILVDCDKSQNVATILVQE